MFGITKTKQQSQQESQQESLVHTMADDIAQAKSHSTHQQATEPDSPTVIKETPEPQPVQESTANSPFLSQQPQNQASQQPEQIKNYSQKTKRSKHHKMNNFWLLGSIIGIIVIFGILFLVYYLLKPRPTVEEPVTHTTDTSTQQIKEDTTNAIPVVEVIKTEETIPVTDQTTISDLHKRLQQIDQDKRLSHTPDPLKITITKQNVSLSFRDFAQQFLPLLPQNLLTAMDHPFELYLFSEGSDEFRLSIAAITNMPEATNTILRQNEIVLPEAMSPLFLFTAPEATEAPEFHDSSYKHIPIRFYNFASDGSQSIDYVAHYQHIFFGTSLQTIRDTMDTVFANENTKSSSIQPSNNTTQIHTTVIPIPAGPNDPNTAP